MKCITSLPTIKIFLFLFNILLMVSNHVRTRMFYFRCFAHVLKNTQVNRSLLHRNRQLAHRYRQQQAQSTSNKKVLQNHGCNHGRMRWSVRYFVVLWLFCLHLAQNMSISVCEYSFSRNCWIKKLKNKTFVLLKVLDRFNLTFVVRNFSWNCWLQLCK